MSSCSRQPSLLRCSGSEPESPLSGASRTLGHVRCFLSNFDVTVDGQRLLVTLTLDSGDVAPTTPRINVVLNWFEQWKQRVPTGR